MRSWWPIGAAGRPSPVSKNLIDRSTTLPCQLAATPTIGEIVQSDIGRHGVSFLFGPPPSGESRFRAPTSACHRRPTGRPYPAAIHVTGTIGMSGEWGVGSNYFTQRARAISVPLGRKRQARLVVFGHAFRIAARDACAYHLLTMGRRT